MLVVILNYIQPLEVVEKYIAQHRSFLDEGYKNNFLIASGPKKPRTGGILLSQLDDRNQLEDFLKDDPYFINKIASYEIIEFEPVKYHEQFACFINKY